MQDFDHKEKSEMRKLDEALSTSTEKKVEYRCHLSQMEPRALQRIIISAMYAYIMMLETLGVSI